LLHLDRLNAVCLRLLGLNAEEVGLTSNLLLEISETGYC
jgi:hypothetical protein